MIYVAGKFTAKARIDREAQRLRRMGFPVSSTWLDETETDYSASEEYKLECAIRDYGEVATANGMILDTIDVSETGGREVELGMAIGHGVPVYIVGPLRNVFHWMVPANHRFEDWDALVRHFDNFN